MRYLKEFFPLALLLLASCATRPDTGQPQETARIERRLQEIFDAAEKKDMGRLDSYHLYGPKFTKFAPGTQARQDAATAQQRENAGLGAINDLAMKATDLKIDLFGDVAITTFILDYSFKIDASTIERKEFSTIVFVKDHGEWKITHEHLSVPSASDQ